MPSRQQLIAFGLLVASACSLESPPSTAHDAGGAVADATTPTRDASIDTSTDASVDTSVDASVSAPDAGASVCGDGVVNEGEACDDAGAVPASHCLEDCTVRPCGTRFDYRALWLRGFRVCLAESLAAEEPTLAERVLMALDEDLSIIENELPAHAFTFLKRVTIWAEQAQDFPGGVYHPSARWLANNGYPEEWARGIQLGHAQNYMSWVEQQPAIVLHELAHAWHHQALGYDNPEIEAAYAAAMESGIYDEVAYVSGGTAEAYAKTNKQEYFAELTEAWFWRNDFFPFERAELETHDPAGAQVIERAWAHRPSE